jgi:hypothetical protein
MLSNVLDGYNVTIFAYGQTVCKDVYFDLSNFQIVRAQEKRLL